MQYPKPLSGREVIYHFKSGFFASLFEYGDMRSSSIITGFGGIRFLHVKGFDSLGFKDQITALTFVTDLGVGPGIRQKKPSKLRPNVHVSHTN
ncbi:MAG: hypothetical protein M3258_07955 [Thermoproteota archaeon]|nr:hypothetical protein [Thermoproteota archaeon]